MKNKKKTISLIIILVLIITTGCSLKKVNNDTNLNINNNINNIEEITSMKAIINDNEYIVELEDNVTVKSFVALLPQEFNMNDLNNNEKYIYLANSLPINEYKPKHINQGDVMLFGNDCLVIFYKSFDTPYSYTKIGHIDNLPDLGTDNILVRFEK